MIWIVGLSTVGAALFGAALILFSLSAVARLSDGQRRLMLYVGILLIVVAAFSPMLLIVFGG
jgi:hypothetical protein